MQRNCLKQIELHRTTSWQLLSMQSSGSCPSRLFHRSVLISLRSARLSILFSLIRLDPSPKRKKNLLYISGVYFLVAVILISQLFWVCEPEDRHNHWKDAASPQCTLNKQVAISQLVCKWYTPIHMINNQLTSFQRIS